MSTNVIRQCPRNINKATWKFHYRCVRTEYVGNSGRPFVFGMADSFAPNPLSSLLIQRVVFAAFDVKYVL